MNINDSQNNYEDKKERNEQNKTYKLKCYIPGLIIVILLIVMIGGLITYTHMWEPIKALLYLFISTAMIYSQTYHIYEDSEEDKIK